MSVNILGKSYNIKRTINLNLISNGLTSLPAEIGNLINLQGLSLAYNNLTSLPIEIINLTNLKYSYLHNNSLTSLPAEMGNLIIVFKQI